MTIPIPTGEPTVVHAGDSWQWDRTVSQAPPSEGYSLVYRFQGPTNLPDVTAGTDGDTYQVRIPAADTLSLEPGTYRLTGAVEKGADRFTVYTGVLTVRRFLAESLDPEATWSERCLAALQARLEGRLPKDLESFEIHGRAVNLIPVAELHRLHNLFAERVWMERNPGKLPGGITVV